MVIAFTGPESTGKTFLAKNISQRYNGLYLQEYARKYLELKGNRYVYQQSDILNILDYHQQQVNQALYLSPSLLVYDTEVLVLKIWNLYKFGTTHPRIEKAWNEQNVDLYMLCYPDIPWEDDPLRENPFDREMIFDMYIKELEASKRSYEIIKGIGEERILNTDRILSSYL